MKMRIASRFLVSSIAVAAGLALSASLHAGTVMTGEQTQSDGGSITSTISLDAGRARMESDVNGQKMLMIYRGDKDLFWIVDPGSKSYREMTRADMTAMAEQVDKAMQQMQDKLKDLPPEQRAMVEKMMGPMAAADRKKAELKTTYEKVGPGGKVGEWSTEKYIATTDGAKTSELWVAPASAVKIGDAEMKTMEQMMGFFKEVAGKFGGNAMPAIGPESELGGMPVKVISFRDGQPKGTYVVTSVEQKDIPAADFEVPADYAKQDLGLPKM